MLHIQGVHLTEKRIIIALDFPTAAAAEQFLSGLDPASCRVKIGKELFTAAGPDFVRRVVDMGFDVFLDLKFHDIPNTVAGAVRVAAELGVWMINVHASGGVAMMSEARAALEGVSGTRPLLIAVTILTSLAGGRSHQAGDFVQSGRAGDSPGGDDVGSGAGWGSLLSRRDALAAGAVRRQIRLDYTGYPAN